MAESKEQAAAVPTNNAELASKAAAEAAKSKAISEKLRPGQVLDVAFNMPDADSFKNAKWPEKNTSMDRSPVGSGSSCVTPLTKPRGNG